MHARSRRPPHRAASRGSSAPTPRGRTGAGIEDGRRREERGRSRLASAGRRRFGVRAGSTSPGCGLSAARRPWRARAGRSSLPAPVGGGGAARAAAEAGSVGRGSSRAGSVGAGVVGAGSCGRSRAARLGGTSFDGSSFDAGSGSAARGWDRPTGGAGAAAGAGSSAGDRSCGQPVGTAAGAGAGAACRRLDCGRFVGRVARSLHDVFPAPALNAAPAKKRSEYEARRDPAGAWGRRGAVSSISNAPARTAASRTTCRRAAASAARAREARVCEAMSQGHDHPGGDEPPVNDVLPGFTVAPSSIAYTASATATDVPPPSGGARRSAVT